MRHFTKICSIFSEHLILSVIFMEIMGVEYGISLLVNYDEDEMWTRQLIIIAYTLLCAIIMIISRIIKKKTSISDFSFVSPVMLTILRVMVGVIIVVWDEILYIKVEKIMDVSRESVYFNQYCLAFFNTVIPALFVESCRKQLTKEEE